MPSGTIRDLEAQGSLHVGDRFTVYFPGARRVLLVAVLALGSSLRRRARR